SIPGVEFSYGYAGRSNKGASSSRSVLSGQQSLEPSQSTEMHRRTAALAADWNLLDAVLALNEAASAEHGAAAARERYAKVVQNVERDVYAAYWRALAWQEVKDKDEAIHGLAAEQIEKINIAVDEKLISPEEAGEKSSLLAERQRTLFDLRDRARLA